MSPDLMDAGLALLVAMVRAAAPLMFAALGELIAERAGVLNLGVEGMMLMGAVGAFAAASATGSTSAGVLAAAGMGIGMALLFGVLTLHLMANQVATGLALTIFGVGLSAFLGQGMVGATLTPPPAILLGLDALAWGALLLAAALWWFLGRTRPGLVLRAVGENPHAAHAIGYPVRAIRYGAVACGGALCGIGGAYLSLVYIPMWAEGMTAGRGWIALALVVFAAWRPERVVLGACLFGGITIAQLHGQAGGLALPSQVLSMLPYLATIVVLVLMSRRGGRLGRDAPASIGKPFHPEA